MLTTIIYRSHLRDDAPLKALEDMVTAANIKNRRSDVTGILLFNGHHFFQLLEGPEEQVKEIYCCICNDPRHHNIVELMCDYALLREDSEKWEWSYLIYKNMNAMTFCKLC